MYAAQYKAKETQDDRSIDNTTEKAEKATGRWNKKGRTE